jgi:hypothetical protein
MDSVDFAALDFFVGAICTYGVLGEVGGGVKARHRQVCRCTNFRFRHLPCSCFPLTVCSRCPESSLPNPTHPTFGFRSFWVLGRVFGC